MGIYRDEVVYIDPIDPEDVLSATPGSADGVHYGAVGVTHGAAFRDGALVCNAPTMSVSIRPGDELSVLRTLGDQLRRTSTRLHHDKTVVTTVAELERLRDVIVNKYAERHGVPLYAINDLIDLLTGGVNNLYSEAERHGETANV